MIQIWISNSLRVGPSSSFKMDPEINFLCNSQLLKSILVPFCMPYIIWFIYPNSVQFEPCVEFSIYYFWFKFQPLTPSELLPAHLPKWLQKLFFCIFSKLSKVKNWYFSRTITFEFFSYVHWNLSQMFLFILTIEGLNFTLEILPSRMQFTWKVYLQSRIFYFIFSHYNFRKIPVQEVISINVT